MAAKQPAPLTLPGRRILLEPLARHRLPDLFEAGADPEIWQWQGGPAPATEAELGAKLDALLAAAGRGEYVPFAVVDRATGKAVGWTAYMDIDAENERLEIGWTWYGRAYWRTPVNTEAKLLLLEHAFETLGMGRVQWKTDALNLRSQAAIERLGAHREGVLRRHKQRHDGTWRDTVYYSLLATEWPQCKERLTTRLRGDQPR